MSPDRLARWGTAAGLALAALITASGLWGLDALFSRAGPPGVRVVTVGDLDLEGVTDPAERKRRFFDFMRPVVVAENARVARQRDRLLEARRTGHDGPWVKALARRYRVAWTGAGADWDELFSRVDTVPMELALAQAAHESTWGTSRFAVHGNNMFGQWCYRDACGMIPTRRAPGAGHRVAAFAHVNEAVRNYLFNLNVGHAYRAFRRMRAAFRARDERPDPLALAAGLTPYAEEGQAYVEKIRRMIRMNRGMMAGDGGSGFGGS
jgi:Bax protein